MAKANPLANAFKDDDHLAPVKAAPTRAGNGRRSKLATDPTSLVAANLPTTYGRALKMMVAEENTTLKALMEEAFDLLFTARGRR